MLIITNKKVSIKIIQEIIKWDQFLKIEQIFWPYVQDQCVKKNVRKFQTPESMKIELKCQNLIEHSD